MTAFEFPGPGFSAEQWERLSGLATTLKPGQALWISGYFAGIDHGARALRGEAAVSLGVEAPVAADVLTGPATRSLTILFAGETGNSAGVARTLAETVRALGREPTLVDMADYKPRKFKDEQDLLVVTSTHGEGDPPLSAVGFFEFVEGRKAPQPGRHALRRAGTGRFHLRTLLRGGQAARRAAGRAWRGTPGRTRRLRCRL